MLPQPHLRFLLADVPGTGKTIMAGLYLREMQKLGFLSRALVIAPAGLVTKWQADFARFFGGEAQRCVEVKGVWNSAASDGVRMTGNEILIATQQRSDYWLYVIDGCSNGTGNVFGVYRDPISTFGGLIKQEAMFKLPGSALKAARDKTVPA